MELHLLPRVPSFAIRHQLQEGAMTRPSPRATSFDILLQFQEGATRRTTPRVPSLDTLHQPKSGVPRSASTRPRQVKAHLAHQGATRTLPRSTTTCPSSKTTSLHSPSFETYHQARVGAPSQGHQGNKHADANMRRSIRTTFGDIPPLKSVNVDMRRRRRQRHILWCPLVLALQVRTNRGDHGQLRHLHRETPTSTPEEAWSHT